MHRHTHSRGTVTIACWSQSGSPAAVGVAASGCRAAPCPCPGALENAHEEARDTRCGPRGLCALSRGGRRRASTWVCTLRPWRRRCPAALCVRPFHGRRRYILGGGRRHVAPARNVDTSIVIDAPPSAQRRVQRDADPVGVARGCRPQVCVHPQGKLERTAP